MVEVPAATPVATPPGDVTPATAGTLLTHVPAPPASESVVERPIQTVSVPSMAVGGGFTVTVVVLIQPVGSV